MRSSGPRAPSRARSRAFGLLAAGLAGVLAAVTAILVWNAQHQGIDPAGTAQSPISGPVTVSAPVSSTQGGTSPGSATNRRIPFGGSLYAMTVAPGTRRGRPIVILSTDSQLKVFDLESGRAVGAPINARPVVLGTAQLAARTVIVGAGPDNRAQVWDAGTLRQVGSTFTGGPTSNIGPGALGELNGKAIALFSGISHAGSGVYLWLWDVATGRQMGAPLKVPSPALSSVAIGTVDGRKVAVTGGSDGMLRLWDLAAARQTRGPVAAHRSLVSWVSFGELDGRAIVVSAGLYDKAFRIWDPAALRAIGSPVATGGQSISAFTLARVDRRPVAVVGGKDETITVWDLGSRKKRGSTLTGHTDDLRELATAELNGRTILAAADVGGSVRFWDLGAAR